MAIRKLSAVSGTRKKKKSHSTAKKSAPRRHKRRMSGIGKLDLQGMGLKVIGLGVGSVIAREGNALLVNIMGSSFTPKISGLVQIAAGIFLPMVVKGNKFVADIGDGMVANGVMVEVVGFGLISGTDRMSYRINGANDMRTIAGTNRLNAVAGTNRLNAVAGTNRLTAIAGHSRRQAERCH